jgi:hypothetical protein
MLALAEHHAQARNEYPADRLLIVFEIDGPILYRGFRAERADLRAVHGERSAGACSPRLRPHAGVLEVIRWFQLQQSTFVGLNSRRSGRARAETLQSLNTLGRDLKVGFTCDLLHLNESGRQRDVIRSKLEGLRAFTRAGYRPVAVIDQDPAVICAIAEADERGELLLLQSSPTLEPPGVSGARFISGWKFGLNAFVGKDDLPPQVQLVWHGVNDKDNLAEFLASPVPWGECDVRWGPQGHLVLRHDSFERTPRTADQGLLTLAEAVRAFGVHSRQLKIDLKDGPGILDQVLAQVKQHGFEDDRLWFNASIQTLGSGGFHRLRRAHPGAVIQCPVDFLAPLASAAPREAGVILRLLSGWGINRFSVAWGRDGAGVLVRLLEESGYEVNLYGISNHESFLQAVLLLPHSVTADFNFPEWEYYGRGSGEGRRYHRYPKHSRAAAGA